MTSASTPSESVSGNKPAVRMARPATLSALKEDLLSHTPERCGKPLFKHLLILLWIMLLSSGFHMMAAYRLVLFSAASRPIPFAS